MFNKCHFPLILNNFAFQINTSKLTYEYVNHNPSENTYKRNRSTAIILLTRNEFSWMAGATAVSLSTLYSVFLPLQTSHGRDLLSGTEVLHNPSPQSLLNREGSLLTLAFQTGILRFNSIFAALSSTLPLTSLTVSYSHTNEKGPLWCLFFHPISSTWNPNVYVVTYIEFFHMSHSVE